MARGSESKTSALQAGDHATRDGNRHRQGALRTRGGIARCHQGAQGAKIDIIKPPLHRARLLMVAETPAPVRQLRPIVRATPTPHALGCGTRVISRRWILPLITSRP